MQTARVTILMTPDKKAAFDALAASRGMSTGEFFRQAGNRLANAEGVEEEEALALVVDELEKMLPAMQDDLDAIRVSIAEARAAIAEALHEAEAPKPTCEAA